MEMKLHSIQISSEEVLMSLFIASSLPHQTAISVARSQTTKSRDDEDNHALSAIDFGPDKNHGMTKKVT